MSMGRLERHRCAPSRLLVLAEDGTVRNNRRMVLRHDIVNAKMLCPGSMSMLCRKCEKGWSWIMT